KNILALQKAKSNLGRNPVVLPDPTQVKSLDEQDMRYFMIYKHIENQLSGINSVRYMLELQDEIYINILIKHPDFLSLDGFLRGSIESKALKEVLSQFEQVARLGDVLRLKRFQ